ncbi:hypothetical protein ACH5RR_016943 [Cinchona calisaya]|uniref:PGG domain-containing protein n=1 Tax=Cinchona calisaya TaxID=153742 RepID=A0ABD2ZXF8_9GENT
MQSLKTLLASNPSIRPAVQVNSTNAATLSGLNVLLPDEEMGNKIDKIPQRANALKCGAITTQDYVYKGNMTFADTSNSGNQSFPCIYNPSKNSIVVLLISAVTAMTTFYAALHPPRSILKDAYSYELNQSSIFQFQSQNSILTASFIFLNSIVFFSSIAMIMYLTNEFPMRNWLMISICSLLGSYTCSIMALSTNKHVN